MDFINFVGENYLIIVPVLYIIGMIIKTIPNIPDWIIPFALLIIGVTLCVGLAARPDSGMTWIDGAIQGVLVTGAAVLVNQGIKQAIKKD